LTDKNGQIGTDNKG